MSFVCEYGNGFVDSFSSNPGCECEKSYVPIVSLALKSARRESSSEHMRSSLKIASILGIEVRIHITFLLFLAWIWLSYYQIAGASGATQGVLFILALFACVLLHEFGHAFAARAFGIQTPDITLLPIGGVARLSRIPDAPWQELVVAVAGPLVNVVIAAAMIFVVHQAAPLDQLESIENPRIELLAKLASVNIVLVLFNLIPAFPMDGGRVLRALLAMAMPYARATWIAARIGQVLAICLAAYACFGPTKNPILIFIAFFIFIGAQQEAAMARMRQTPPPL
jgi:Zn-dependent protease